LLQKWNLAFHDVPLQDSSPMVPVGFILRAPEQLRAAVRRWRAEGRSTALVPTMGALHRGHLELARAAFRQAERVVVSIFVNPMQFGRSEDLSRYPRDETADINMLEKAGVNLVFAPPLADVYPPDFATVVSLSGSARVGLEDKFRPQFFDGVATVVAKFLIMAECDYALFGEKDYQQLKVVTQMARDLNIPTKIVPVPTVREPDGLAMSSRNSYLNADQREMAPELSKALLDAAKSIRSGAEFDRAAVMAARRLQALGFEVDYVEVRNADTLEPIHSAVEPMRILAAARLGTTRLIDNMAV
jgi:pantoate--beta-alanine ligase